MTARVALAALALTSLFVTPTAAPAAIVEKWHTATGVNYQMLAGGVVGASPVYDLITRESSGTIGYRSGATGALLTQTALAYTPNELWFQDLDNDDIPEMIVWDASGKRVCFDSSTLAARWSTLAFAQPVEMQFVDFDGNGKLYTVFMSSDGTQFTVYDRTGVLVSQVTVPGAPTGSGWTSQMYVYNFDGDRYGNTKQQLLIDYQHTGADELWLFQSSAAVGVEPALAAPMSVELGPSCPNPAFSLSRVEYSTPTTGPVSLRLFDVSGREVRTLVNGSVSAGRHDAAWDGRDAQGRAVAPGAYFYELKAGGQRQTRRVVRLQ